MKWLYFLVDFFTILVPLIFSFHSKIKFFKTWRSFFPAALITGALFIAWDISFTAAGVWNFNPRYVSGFHFFNLPIEEVLFFICIPFSCVFTYFCLDKFYNLSWTKKIENGFCVLLSLALFVVGILFFRRLYTSVTFISTAFVCIVLKYFVKIEWFGKAATVYAILLIPFLIVNGILTGSGPDEAVVRYNNAENLGLRLLTIPVEDVFYGFEMFLLNLSLYKCFEIIFSKKVKVIV